MRRVAIIGGGPAGLMAADVLADVAEVHLYEQGRGPGRKFLVAGDGGLNITNSAAGEAFLAQYTPTAFLRPILADFGPDELRAWLADRGIPTFIGTSGRVFPEQGIKPAQVLRAIRDRLKAKGVVMHFGTSFVGFGPDGLPLLDLSGTVAPLAADRFLFALGGASWQRTGSTGAWLPHFAALGIRTVPFQASNCGVEIALPPAVLAHAGKPLKNIAVSCGHRMVRGEATITAHGLEGNAIYPVVPAVRDALADEGPVLLLLDLKPDVPEDLLQQRLRDARPAERLAALRLDRPQQALLKAFTAKERFLNDADLAHDVKHLALPVHALRPMDEAISTVGGIALEEVDEHLALRKAPQCSVAGEMLDWDAPTGGFLLHAAFATGRRAAMGMAQSLV